ncbi:MAG: S-adenosylmethionine:tRNA ribosyltransferase-isomerase [Candidatus Uhrbacteria bacterium GW2011_GWA2_53_10]|uniref:S-adenosylmethionine:tRNA ribosyltransferase-isomerase n=1 Tax=Candidatus Uhrbacteria bacterium GW2011_GWA2_53_10 TaxID=1618980 RepID=A0A0G2AK83_9BACT|nr:MAG: S-adenosylmethionine:tRNA ribosyltransferase-isomerase [Candidatus Uhrbacteria bacterium GW2011_GWA2_53_10]
METSTELFSFDLPPAFIAQEPMEPRDQSRLMLLDRKTGAWRHEQFFQIVDELKAGDVLVMNNTKVFKARLRGKVGKKEVEVFLLRPLDEGRWEVLLKPGRAVVKGLPITFDGWKCEVMEKRKDGTVVFLCDQPKEVILAYADAHGEIPTPPYVKKIPANLEMYQTVYAEKTGSVAAPTAGFHFTPALLQKIRTKGVKIEFVTLHVGIGTFRPIKAGTLEEHKMHSEFVEVAPAVAQRINRAKEEGRCVIAVGTTTVRVLEGIAAGSLLGGAGRPAMGPPPARSPANGGASTGGVIAEPGPSALLPMTGFTGDVNLFITPGFEFKIVDAIITNFHLPKSTLLVLVSAFAGREHILAAYQEAIRQGYRFYSFGDAMLIQ